MEPHLDLQDPRQLFLRSEAGAAVRCCKAFQLLGRQEGDGLVLTLTFEDTRRCAIAESHLRSCRKKAEPVHSREDLASFLDVI